jgi:molecular chaperone DnaK (HSP70)
MAVERVLGIDFGTSTSVIKVKTYKDGGPLGARDLAEYVRFGGGSTTPTLIFNAKDGRAFFGAEAENASAKGIMHRNFKLDLISPDGEKRAEAVRLTRQFFKYLHDAYQASRNSFPECDIETTHISYPAKWPDSLRAEMEQIVRDAGFFGVKGITEPAAAVYAVMVQEEKKLAVPGSGKPLNILLIDMGAGTTDLVLCEYIPSSRNVEIVTTWPEADSDLLLGGREIDEALCKYVKAYLADCGLPEPRNFDALYLDKCRVWKETNVSPTLRDGGAVRYAGFIDALLSVLDVERDFPPITRESFEDMLKDYLAQFPQMVIGCLERARFNPHDLDAVILTGGHSQWYFMDEMLSGTSSKLSIPFLTKIKEAPARIIRMSWPQETVAMGLVFQPLVAAKDAPAGEPAKPARFCASCGKPVKEGAAFCGNCGKPAGMKPMEQEPGMDLKALSESIVTSGAGAGNIPQTSTLLKPPIYVCYYHDIRQSTGKLSIFTDKIVFKAMAVIGGGYSHEYSMSDVLLAERASKMGINLCIKVSTKQGKSYVYALGLGYADIINEVVRLINHHKGT